MKNYTLHAREKKLLSYLNNRHGIVTAKEISEKMGISERTIRSDIARINQAMEANGVCIRTVYSKGYCLEIQDREAFHCLFSDEKNIQTKEDRIRYLILRLVSGEEICNLCDLEEDIFISRTTLENDLKEVRKRISENQPYLQMKRCADEIWIENDELKKRNILIHLYCRDWDYDSRDGIIFRDSVIEKQILDQIRIELKNTLDTYEIELDDFGLIYLTIALAICYVRALEGKELALTAEWKKHYEATVRLRYLSAIKGLMQDMEKIWELQIEADVCLWISVILTQLNILNLHTVNWEEACHIVEPDCLKTEQQILEMMELLYGVCFREDQEFCAGLLIHIQALRNGMISLQQQNLYILEDLKQQFPFWGELSHQICRYLEDNCHITVGVDGEYFLLPLLILAQTRQMEIQKDPCMKISVVSHFNRGLTGCLMKQLEQKFGARVKLDGPYPVYDRNKMEARKPRCILTTVQMDVFRQFDVPVLTISARLTGKEQENIEKQIQKMEEQCLLDRLPKDRSAYFSSDLSIRISQKKELPQIWREMQKRFFDLQFVQTLFISEVETASCVMLKNGVIFTYFVGDIHAKTVFGMAELESVISWKQYKGIRRVLVLLLNPEHRRYLRSFYQLAQDVAEHRA